MEQSQLLELLGMLTAAEKEGLRQFYTVSLFNTSRFKIEVKQILDISLEFLSDQDKTKVDKNVVYEKVFPNESFVVGKIEKVMVEAHKVVKMFLITQNYLRDDNAFDQNLDFANIVRKRGLENRFSQSINFLKKIQEQNIYKNADYFKKQFHLETAIHYIQSIGNQSKGEINIPNVLLSTEAFYLSRRISLLSRYLNQLKATKLDIPAFMSEQIEYLTVPDIYLEQFPIIDISFKIFNILKGDTPVLGDIELVLGMVKTNEHVIDHETLQEFYTYLRNFASLLLAKDRDNNDVCKLLHELFLDSLERGLLHYEGKIVPNRFMSIVENALKIKKYEWVVGFIEKHKEEILDDTESKDIYRLNMALYLFEIGDFKKCLDYIPPTSSFLYYLLTIKRLELKVYYEMGNDLFSYKLDAFKMFLSRTSPKILSESQRISHVDFANMLSQIYASTPGDKKRSAILVNRLESKKNVVEWRWLLAKAHALAAQKP